MEFHSCENGSCHIICEQQNFADMQSHHSPRCLLSQYRELGEASDKDPEGSPDKTSEAAHVVSIVPFPKFQDSCKIF